MEIEFTVNGKKVNSLADAFGSDFKKFVEDGLKNHVEENIADIRCDDHPEFVPKFTLEDLEHDGKITACCESFARKLRE